MFEDQEVINYCDENKVFLQIEIIRAEQINRAWKNIVDKKLRYPYIIDTESFLAIASYL